MISFDIHEPQLSPVLKALRPSSDPALAEAFDDALRLYSSLRRCGYNLLAERVEWIAMACSEQPEDERAVDGWIQESEDSEPF